jgi:hypothetical protein
MTHTLNRKGLSEDRRGEEIVFLAMVHRRQKTEKIESMKQIAATVLKYQPLNILGAPLGMEPEDIVSMCAQAGIVTAVFSSQSDVQALVAEIKSQKLGISVVLSGLFSDVHDICRATGLTEHTFNLSLGIFGNTRLLPDEKTLEITTQCGHALISPYLVKKLVQKIKKGKMQSSEAAAMLVKPCVCGIGNPQRIKRLLDEQVVAQQPA